jgi:hypothetical protein
MHDGNREKGEHLCEIGRKPKHVPKTAQKSNMYTLRIMLQYMRHTPTPAEDECDPSHSDTQSELPRANLFTSTLAANSSFPVRADTAIAPIAHTTKRQRLKSDSDSDSDEDNTSLSVLRSGNQKSTMQSPPATPTPAQKRRGRTVGMWFELRTLTIAHVLKDAPPHKRLRFN